MFPSCRALFLLGTAGNKMNPQRPNLTLFRQFVRAADLILLNRMSRIINQRIFDLQGESFSSTGASREQGPSKSSLALEELWPEDWTDLFQEYDRKTQDFYVYLHVDPKLKTLRFSTEKWSFHTRMPFYVGMGQGERIFSKKRSRMHEHRIREIIANGFGSSSFMQFHKKGLCEAEAREIESKLILFFGIRTAFASSGERASRKMLSGVRPCLLNQKYERFPEKYMHYAYNGLDPQKKVCIHVAASQNLEA